MGNINLYHISENYVNYLIPYAPHMFHNKKPTQKKERKYIGIVLHINDIDYFAPLSSFKEKHRRLRESLDFLKIQNLAVINLNNMFPVPQDCYFYVDIAKEPDLQYRALLLNEYRYIKSIQNKIINNARNLYQLKINGAKSPLTQRCNDFLKLEEMCKKI